MSAPDNGELSFDAEVAEIPAHTAFTGRKKAKLVTARLIVRRVRDPAKPATVGEQGELFPVWRYHPFFTDDPASMLQAEREHRHHADVEQAIADSEASALAHLPSGHFHANAAWLTLWATAYHLLRAAGTLASAFHAQGHHRHLARSPRPCPRQDRPLRPAPDTAPAAAMALAGLMGAVVRRRPRTARSSPASLTASPTRAHQGPTGAEGRSLQDPAGGSRLRGLGKDAT
ncbi:hypothetical protein AB0L75_42930 [Streptomyces sp. NPDC052101]|uniref:hypothetical protein n=1 Tax=Streptomyces sp. NPDC052101 TaxID=3155763 RepID=UPI00343E69C0